MLVLRSDDGQGVHMRAFSGEVARHIIGFTKNSGDSVPTIYRMLEEICEHNELVLVKVKVYDSGEVLRANLYLREKGTWFYETTGHLMPWRWQRFTTFPS